MPSVSFQLVWNLSAIFWNTRTRRAIPGLQITEEKKAAGQAGMTVRQAEMTERCAAIFRRIVKFVMRSKN